MRVVKGYHAEEREHSVFAEGVQRLLENVMKSLTMTSTLGAASTMMAGLVSALVMYFGGHAVLRGTWTVGDYFQYNMFLVFMIAPVIQIVNIGTQLTEAFAGLDHAPTRSWAKWKRTRARAARNRCRRFTARCSLKTSGLPMKWTSRFFTT